MSLPPAEQQALARIESHLRRSDPRLAIMLEIFGRQPYQRKGPVGEGLSPWRPRARHLRLFALMALLAIACLLLVIMLGRTAQSAGARTCSPVATRITGCMAPGTGPAQPRAGQHSAKTGP